MAQNVEQLLIRIDATTEQLRRQMRQADQVVAQSSSRIDRELEKIDRRFDTMNRAAGFATKAIGGYLAALSVGAVANFASKQLEAADAVGQVAEMANLSTDSLQELRYAFSTLAQVTDGQVDAALRRFNRRLGLAREGAGPAKAAFENLFGGVSQFTTTEQALDAVIERLAAIEDQSVRAAQASAFFGDDAGPYLAAALGKGSAAINQLRQDAHDLGLVLDQDIISNAGQIRTEFDKAQRILSTSFMRGLNNAMPALLKMADASARIAKHLGNLFDPRIQLQDEIQELAKQRNRLLDELNQPRRFRSSVFGSDDDIKARVNRINQIILEKQRELQDLLAKSSNLPVLEPVIVTGDADSATSKYLEGLQRAIALHGKASEVAKARYEIERGALQDLSKDEQDRILKAAAQLDALHAAEDRKLSEQKEAEELERQREATERRLQMIREALMTERDLEIAQYEEKRAWLKEVDAEHFEYEDEKRKMLEDLEAQHKERLKAIDAKSAQDRTKIEKDFSDTVNALRMGVFAEFAALLRAMPGESKAAAYALLAIEKGLRIAETFISTQAAAQRALAELGPIKGAAMSAKILALGKARMGLIAATGLVEAAGMGSTGGSGGGSEGGRGAAPDAAPDAPPAQNEPEKTAVDVTLRLDSRRTRYAREELEDIIEGLNELLKDGATIGSIRVS